MNDDQAKMKLTSLNNRLSTLEAKLDRFGPDVSLEKQIAELQQERAALPLHIVQQDQREKTLSLLVNAINSYILKLMENLQPLPADLNAAIVALAEKLDGELSPQERDILQQRDILLTLGASEEDLQIAVMLGAEIDTKRQSSYEFSRLHDAVRNYIRVVRKAGQPFPDDLNERIAVWESEPIDLLSWEQRAMVRPVRILKTYQGVSQAEIALKLSAMMQLSQQDTEKLLNKLADDVELLLKMLRHRKKAYPQDMTAALGTLESQYFGDVDSLRIRMLASKDMLEAFEVPVEDIHAAIRRGEAAFRAQG